jgi:hypothetical protein
VLQLKAGIAEQYELIVREYKKLGIRCDRIQAYRSVLESLDPSMDFRAQYLAFAPLLTQKKL